MNGDRDLKPDNIDPMTAVLERRREMLRRANEIQPPGGLRRPRYFRGDYEARRLKRR